MLRIEVDDETSRALVLRAPVVPALVARRALATVLAVASVVGAAAAVVWWRHDLSRTAACFALFVSLVLAGLALDQPPAEVAELGVDGQTGTLWLVIRGEWCWRTRRVAVRSDAVNHCIRLSGALLPPGLRRAEMGLALFESFAPPGGASAATDAHPASPLTPRFAVAGLDRRDEFHAFAELLARRLGLRVAHRVDTLHRLAITLGREGESPPPPAPPTLGGFRARATAAALDLTRAAAFEPPRESPPPLPADGSGELCEELSLHPALTVTQHIPSASREALRGLALAIAGGLVVLALVQFAAPTHLWAALLFLLGLGLIVALSAGAAAAVWWIPRGILHGIALLLSAGDSAGPGRVIRARQPRRWRVEGHVLHVDRGGGSKPVDRAALGPAVIVHRTLTRKGRPPWRYRQLWIDLDSRWTLLAASRLEEAGPLQTPTLDALAVAVASALDVPLRIAE